jgi:tripartite-type tricarboxylate transporter receptor subunit TctC
MTTLRRAERARRLSWGALGATTLLLAIGGGARQQATAAEFDAEKYFKGKTITLVLDFKPGGGTDTEARFFAANWGKFIPGNPKITVTNLFPKPSGHNYVWKAKPDGLTLCFLGSPGIGDEITDKNAEFTSKAGYTFIGSHQKRDVSLISSGKVPFNSLKEASGGSVPITVADSLGSEDELNGKLFGTALLAHWFNVPFKVFTVARSGSSDGLLMLERGDVNTHIAGSLWYSLPRTRPGWFKNNVVKVIADMGYPEAPMLANSEISMPVPNVVTWMNEEQRAIWGGVYLTEVLYGNGISGPPNMPPEVTEALRDSYAKALRDPKFAQDLERIQDQPISHLPGEKMQQLVKDSTESFKKSLPVFKQLRAEVYHHYFK